MNAKIYMFCWRCRERFDMSEAPAYLVDVKCHCGGHIVTPSGKASIQYSLTLSCYIVSGKKSVGFIGAEDESDAVALFEEAFPDDEVVSVVKEQQDKLHELSFFMDPDQTGDPAQMTKTSAYELLLYTNEHPIMLANVKFDELDKNIERSQAIEDYFANKENEENDW